MVHHDRIPLSSTREWEAALEGLPHGIAHTWEYCRAMQRSSGLNTFLYSFRDGAVRIVCPIAERVFRGRADIVTPYGFSGFVGTGDCRTFPDCWSEFARAQGYVCGFIGLNPLFGNETHVRPEETHEYNDVYVLDLTADLEDIHGRLSVNRKRQLRDWDALSGGLLADRAALAAFFLDTYVEFFRSRGASRAYGFSPEALSALFGLGRVLLVGAAEGGRIEAVSVFGYTAHVGDFLFNVSVPEGRRHSAALLWQGVRRLKELNVPLLNLGGGVRRGDRLAEFKQRFGGSRLPLKCLKQVYRPQAYAELCREAGIDPGARDGYFPAYRSP